MKEKKVWFKNSRGQKLCGILEGPKSDKAILLISGYASGKEEWDDFMVRYAAALNKAGFLTLRFDRAGIGESEGDFVEATMESELDDCIAAYNFLKTKAKKIGVAGHSMGGALVIMLASKVKLGAIIASSPSVEPGKTVDKLFTTSQFKTLEQTGRLKVPKDWQSFGIKFFGKVYLESRRKFDVSKYTKKVKAPTFIIYGTRDKYISLSEAELLYNLLKCKKELKIFKGLSHGFKPNEKLFHDAAINWFKKYLK